MRHTSISTLQVQNVKKFQFANPPRLACRRPKVGTLQIYARAILGQSRADAHAVAGILRVCLQPPRDTTSAPYAARPPPPQNLEATAAAIDQWLACSAYVQHARCQICGKKVRRYRRFDIWPPHNEMFSLGHGPVRWREGGWRTSPKLSDGPGPWFGTDRRPADSASPLNYCMQDSNCG